MGTRTAALVLGYHAISDTWPSDLAVSSVRLRQQLRYLLRRGYSGATFTEVVRGEASRKAVAVTFDDGCTSVLDRAFPILSELGLVGTVFVPTGFVGGSEPMSWAGLERWIGSPYEDELICLDWDQLRRLQSAGWEIGSHSRSHPRLTQLEDGALARELAESRDELTQGLGRTCTSLAYPYGHYDDRVCEAARAAGYEGAATMRPGPPDPFRFPRVGVSPADVTWRFRAKSSRAMMAMRASRLGRLLERRRQARAGTDLSRR